MESEFRALVKCSVKRQDKKLPRAQKQNKTHKTITKQQQQNNPTHHTNKTEPNKPHKLLLNNCITSIR